MYKCPSALPNVWYIALIDHTGSNQRITSKPHKVKVKILTLRDYPGSISRSVTHGWFTPTLTIITEGNSNSGLALWVNIWNPHPFEISIPEANFLTRNHTRSKSICEIGTTWIQRPLRGLQRQHWDNMWYPGPPFIDRVNI